MRDLKLLADVLECPVDDIVEEWFKWGFDPHPPSYDWLVRVGREDEYPEFGQSDGR